MDISTLYNSLKQVYLKLLIVNKENNTFDGVTIPCDEQPPNNNIYDYFNWFISGDYIHTDDKSLFVEFIKDLSPNADVIYRRKTDNGYKSVYMEIRDCDETHYIICVRDIDTTFKREALKVEENAKRFDSTTGLLNHKAFEDDIRKELKGNVGVAFIDINGLKWVNDHWNHSKGDELIQKVVKILKMQFPAYSIYRTGGDEFVVIAYNVKTRVFIHTVTALHKRIWNELDDEFNFPIFSIGYSADISEDIIEIIEDAERQMYEDKSIFYEKNPQLKRN